MGFGQHKVTEIGFVMGFQKCTSPGAGAEAVANYNPYMATPALLLKQLALVC